MSESGTAERVWRERDAGIAPVERVRSTVRILTRARCRQLLAEHLVGGLFFGLLAASVVLTAERAGALLWPLTPLMTAAVTLPMLAALLLAWRRFPDPLSVAIAADLKLNLRQRLSSAFEFIRSDASSALSQRLAQQVVRARIPARPELTFPIRLTNFGRVLPLAVLLLAIASMLEFEPAADAGDRAVDALVVHEGVRLRDYARRLAQRSNAQQLPRSRDAARKLERLGSRMESGTLGRERVLERLAELGRGLDEERRRAMMEADQRRIGALKPQPLDLDERPNLRPNLRLDRLLEGATLSSEELRGLAENADELLRGGASDEELARARRALEAGDGELMRRLIEDVARAERAVSDARSLDEARSRIDRARRNLGDRDARAESPPEDGPGARRESGGDAELPSGADSADDMSLDDELSGAPGSRAGSEPQRPRRDAPVRPGSPSARSVIRPRSQLGEGPVFSSSARVLPREGEVSAAGEAPDVSIEAQMEAVLARDDYPRHYKEFVRRYFLNLSEGVRQEDARQ